MEETYIIDENKPKKPDHYLPRSIAATVFSACACCAIPVGLPALINSLKVNRLYRDGHYAEAAEASAKAKKWSRIGFWAGGLGVAAYILFWIVYFVFIVAAASGAFN